MLAKSATGTAIAVACALVLPACGGRRGDGTLGSLPSHYAGIDGVRVHWKEAGSGEPVLMFVPGWASDMRVWKRQLEVPPAPGRLLFVDLPGHGGSDAPERDYPFEWLAAAMEAVRVDAGADRLVLVGHSNGAAVTRVYLREYPQHVSALVSVEGSLQPVMSDPKMWDRLVARFRQADYVEPVEKMLPPDMDTGIRADLLDMMMSTPQHVMVATLVAFGEATPAPGETIGVPVLALHAPSRFWTTEYRQWLRGIAPDLRWMEREGVGHFLMLEDPAWVAESVGAFLENPEAER
jgi:pimeloyl-ACP methyl ester carboxylesterase